jgi:sensor histidine kinase YesM
MNLRSKSVLKDIIVLPKWAWLRHVVLVVFVFTNLFMWDAQVTYSNINNGAGEAISKNLLKITQLYSVYVFFIALLMVYSNIYVLVPKLFLKQKYAWYSLAILIFSLVFFVLSYMAYGFFYTNYEQYIDPMPFTFINFIQSTITPLAFLGATTGIKIFKQWIIDSERFAALQQNELQNELTHLKNQVNPHFLFNTLNNIRTLNEVDVQKANQVLLGLSDILRYQIYDSTREFIKLKKDIEILDDYLMLEKIRRENFSYQIVIDGDISGLVVPPLLFINFVENAIKHGADSRNNSYCNLYFKVVDKQLHFICENSKPSVVVKSNGGLGISNIERRLDLLYPNKHSLKFENESSIYTVNLAIPI